jgi:hypothetical protein
MRETDTWRTNSFIVGSPAYQIPTPNTRRKKQTEETSINKPKEGWGLTHKIELSPLQAQEFYRFLIQFWGTYPVALRRDTIRT